MMAERASAELAIVWRHRPSQHEECLFRRGRQIRSDPCVACTLVRPHPDAKEQWIARSTLGRVVYRQFCSD